MKEKFNLSEKIIECKGDVTQFSDLIYKEDVKEAIRLIKLNPDKIDEIVGEKLI